MCAGLGARMGCRQLMGMVSGVMFLFFPLATVAVAGQEAASIIGQVTDESGAVLPGVSVTATSPALQVQQITTVTDGRGEYRLAPLPIGTYTVLYELPGFQSVRQDNVRLTVGFAARLDVILKVSGLAETVTVSGASPVVDVTATATSTRLTRETLELIPTARYGYISLLGQAPGVRTNFDVGGSAFEAGGGMPIFRAFGQTAESWQTLEGVLTAAAKPTQSGNFIDYSVLEEADVQTLGADAEMPTRGIKLAAIVKSGSNQFHGATWWSITGRRLQSSNLDEVLAAQGVQSAGKVHERRTISTNLGGFIVPNRLWFYGGVNHVRNRIEQFNVLDDKGSPAVNFHYATFLTAKLSYQIGKGNRLIYFRQQQVMDRMSLPLNQFTPWESRIVHEWNSPTSKIEWQAVRGSSLAISAQYGYWIWAGKVLAPTETASKRATFDVFTQVNGGPSWGTTSQYHDEHNHHAKASATWFRPDLLRGNHEFKGGFDYVSGFLSRGFHSKGVSPTGESLDYRLQYNNGVPFLLDALNSPSDPESTARYLGMYAKDQWTIARKLTFNLGVRYAHDNGYVPEQCREAAAFTDFREFVPAQCFPKKQLKLWNTVAPRIHAAYDITGDGKTVIKGGWGRFDHRRDVDPEVVQFNPNVAYFITFRWRDLNGNKRYDRGEVNLDPTGPDYVTISPIGNSSGTSFAVPNPNEKKPKQDQFSLSLERELRANMAIRFTGLYARGYNYYWLANGLRPFDSYTVAVTRPDPGLDGLLATSDDPGTSLTYFEYPVALRGRQFEQGIFVNDPPYVKKYTSFELAAAKRLSNRWQFMVSYSATKVNEPVVNPAGAAPPALNPNSFINTANDNWEWLGKASGVYILPVDVMLSANFEHRSGDPWARTVLLTGGLTIPSIAVNAEPFGTRRLPNTNLLDFRVEKRFSVANGHRLVVRMNVYNLTNINSALTLSARSGRLFGVPTSIVPPRLVEFGGSYEF